MSHPWQAKYLQYKGKEEDICLYLIILIDEEYFHDINNYNYENFSLSMMRNCIVIFCDKKEEVEEAAAYKCRGLVATLKMTDWNEMIFP